MLIEFIKNPDFKAPQPPPIRVGSVVRTATDNYKGVVAKIDWQSNSWADYPPKAGMVVEGTSSKDKYVLFGVRGIGWTVIHGKGERDVVNWSDGDVMEFYLPRPDLMPRFVTEGRR